MGQTIDVVLLKDVERLGTEGAVVHVKAGFARNYLMPQGFAVPASPQELERVAETKRRRQQQVERAKEQALSLKQKLEARSLTLRLSLGEEEQAFGSVSVHDLVTALAQDGITIEKSAVQLERPIKRLGIYEVPVKLHPEITATLKVWVVKE